MVAGIVGSSVALASCNGELVPTQTTTPTTTDTTPTPTTTVEPTTTTPVVPTTTTSEAPSVFTVTFDPLNGVNQPRGVEVNDGETVTAAPASSKEPTEHVRYTFAGWYTSTDGGTTLSAEPFDFTTPITANITLYAKYNATELVYVTVKQLNGANDILFRLDKGEKITAEDLGRPQMETCVFNSWCTLDEDGETLTQYDFNTEINSDLTIYAKWASVAAYEGYVRISSAADFKAFRADEKNKDKNVVLTRDIDLSNVTLSDSNIKDFSGIFDGNGHTIKNANFKVTGNKTGLIFKSLVGGTVKNLKFSTCTIDAASQQGVGLIVGLVGGNAKFEDLEFSACNVLNGSSYVGLIGGELGETGTKTGTVTVDRITVKNQTRVATSQYGGMLFGDINGPFTIVSNDLDIEGTLVSSGNGTFVFGRVRPTTSITLRNAILKANTNDKNNILINNAQKTNDCVFENVVVITDNKLEPRGETQTNEGKTITYTNFYTTGDNNKGGAADKGVIADTTKIEKSVVTLDWLKETLHLDFSEDGAWVEEGEGAYRLKSASSNVRDPQAHITNIMVATSAAKTRYKVGETSDTTGLIILATFDNGTQLVVPHDEFDIDFSKVKFDEAGNYSVAVSLKGHPEVAASFNVVVAENDGWAMNDEFITREYLVGGKLDLSNLRVYSLWSDNQSEALAQKKDDNDDGYTLDLSGIDMNRVGPQSITLTYKDFEALHITIDVHAAAPQVIDNHVYVNVNAEQQVQVTTQKGVNTFSTITDAIDYLEACKLSDSVVKVVYIAAGTYTEKINTSLNNLHLVGESKDNTIITYSAVESTISPLTNAPYGLNTDDCATVHINGKGFAATNLQIRNDFDYLENMTTKAESDPQGLALTINGDGAVLSNVLLHGNQDTLFLKSGRAYFKGCTIEGNVDFIFGENSGVGLFDTCTIKALNRGATNKQTGYVTAMRASADNAPTYGYVFLNCNLTSDELVGDGTMSLGRPWGEKATVAYISCTFSKAYSTLAYEEGIKISRWFAMSAALPQNANFVEYDSKGEGAITEEVFGGKILTAAQAANYTLANILSNTNGNVRFADSFNFPQILADLEEEATKVDATDIRVVQTIEVAAGARVKLEIEVLPWNALDKTFTLTPDESGIYGYDPEDLTIYGNHVGTGKLIVSQGNISKEITIIVSNRATYLVTFVTYGGTAVADQPVVEDEKVDATKAVTSKTYAVFKGWYTDDKFENKFDIDNETVSGDMVLYAKFVGFDDLAKDNATFYFDGTEGNGYDSFASAMNLQGKTEAAPGEYFAFDVWGAKLQSRWDRESSPSPDTQINADTHLRFAVKSGAIITVTYSSNTSANLKLGNGVIGTLDGGKVLSAFVTEDGEVVLNQTAAGYLKKIEVTYPTFVDGSVNLTLSTANENLVAAFPEGAKVEGNTASYEGFFFDATTGKIALRAGDVQFGTGAKIEFYVRKGATVTVFGYPGYFAYSVNGVEATNVNTELVADKDMKITVLATGGQYLKSISVSYPTPVLQTTELILGTNNTELAAAVGNSGKVEGAKLQFGEFLIDATTGKFALNGGDNVQTNAGTKIEFYVLKGAKVTVVGYPGLFGYSINGVAATEATTEYVAPETMLITVLSTGDSKYLKAIRVEYTSYIQNDVAFGLNSQNEEFAENFTEGKLQYTTKQIGDFFFDATGTAFRLNNNDSVQFFTNAKIEFNVLKGAKVTVVGYPGYFAYSVNGVAATTAETVIEATENMKVIILATGDQYLKGIKVEYPHYIESSVDFGLNSENETFAENFTGGKLEYTTKQIGDFFFDATATTFRLNNTDSVQFYTNAKIEFNVRKGARVVVVGYPGYFGYSVNGVEATTAETVLYATEDMKVTVLATADQYLKAIRISYPEYVEKDVKYVLGSSNADLATAMGGNTLQKSTAEYDELFLDASASTAKIYLNGGDNIQFNTGSKIEFYVRAFAEVTVKGYSGNFAYSVNGVEATSVDTTIVVKEDTLITIEATGNKYLKAIEIKY